MATQGPDPKANDSPSLAAAPAEPSPGTSESTVWRRLKRHKVLEWTLAYAAAAYTLLHVLEMVGNAFDWPHLVGRIATLLLILGVPIAVTLAWYHGHRGQHRISGPEIVIVTLLLFLAGSMLWWLSAGHAQKVAATVAPTTSTIAPLEKSIAVLPFVDMSEKHNQEYFGDGMAEEITNLLTKIPDLKVIGRTSSFSFKGKADDLRTIGTALGTAYVVEGSVRRDGNHVRVTAQLIDTRDGTHRWSDTYDRDVSDVLAVQDEIAASLVRALQLEVTSSSYLQRAKSQDSDAYDSYLRGLHALNRFDRAGLDEAVAQFRHTLEVDPSFAPADEQLANALFDEAEFSFVPPRIGFEQARSAASAALKLDPKSAIAHAILGRVHYAYDWDWEAANRELMTAVGLAPTNSVVLLFAGDEPAVVGQLDESLHLFDAAVTVDPLNAQAYEYRASDYYGLGRLQEAESDLRRMLQISPTYGFGHYLLGSVLLKEGKTAAALAEMQKERDGLQSAGLALVYQALHRTKEADTELERLEAEHAGDMAYWIAEVCAFRGQKDVAFKWLDRAYTQKDINLWVIKFDPLMKNLEADPRYKAFLRKMNLPE